MAEDKKGKNEEAGYQRPPAKQQEDGAVKSAQPEKTKEKKKVRKRTVFKYMVFNFIKAGFCLFCVGLIVFSILATQMVEYVVAETENDDVILDLENIKLKQTSYFMVLNPDNPNAKEEDDWIQYQELVGPEDRTWVSLDKIPSNMVNAMVATEDREFYEHHGVSFKRTAYALLNEVFEFKDKSFGASTIDQQLVKNLTGDDVVAEEGDRSAGYMRKLREIFRAWGLNNQYSKDMIMEAYLNTMSLSGTIGGVQAGAKKYFNKDVSDLTLWECATIAGITRAPSYYSPFRHPDRCLKRRNDVLFFMRDTDKITEEEYQNALQQPLGLAEPDTNQENSVERKIFSYFADMAFETLVKDLMKEHEWNRSTAINYIYTGGLKVYLTVDLKVQNVLEDMYEHGYEEGGFFLDPKRFPGYQRALTVKEKSTNAAGEEIITEVLPQSAATVLNYDGELVAIVGGIGPKTENLVLNRAVGTVIDGEVEGSVRQVGSTMKPIAAYALGIDYGLINYSSMIMDAGVQPRNPGKPMRNGETGAVVYDWPKNFSNRYRNHGIPVVSAISESTNTVPVRVGMWLGKETMFEFLRDTLQISSLADPQDEDYGPLVLGSLTYGMSVYELAGAYMMFGGNDTYGVFNSLHCYTKVEDSRGNIILEPAVTSVQAIDPQSGYVMNRMLSTVLRGGAPGVSPTAGGMAVAGEMDSVAKTGTTSDDKDRWFVGLTPYYVTAVWWGYDENYDLYGKWSPSARTNVPPNVWKYLMETVQADLPVKEFPAMPEGVTTAAYCTISGKLAGEGCPRGTGIYTSFGKPDVCEGIHDAPEEEPAA